MAFSTILSVVSASLLLVCGGRLLYEQYYGKQNCEMTYMYFYPQYQRVHLDQSIEDSFPQYSLHYYSESHERHDSSLDSRPLKVSGVPALFIPGNAGSHKQSRSSASISLRMQPAEFAGKRHFDFFTVNLNEELSGMFGGVLEQQTRFVAACIRHILSLYSGLKVKPQSVAIVAHSMGGLVAQALFGVEDFNSSWVTTIITLASPLRRPVVSFDHSLQQFYNNVNKVWSDSGVSGHVTLVSVAGGERDVMIPTHLTAIPGAITISAPAVARNWVSADHQAVVWCRRMQLALTRALLVLQDASRREITRDWEKRERVFRYYLTTGKEIPENIKTNISLNLSRAKHIQSSSPEAEHYSQEGFNSSYSHVALPLHHGNIKENGSYLLASNTGKLSWAYVCVVSKKAECTDISSLAALLPPKMGVVKYLPLRFADLPRLVGGATHIVLSQPRDLHPKSEAKGLLLVEQCLDEDRTLDINWWWGGRVDVSPGHCTLLNFSLPQLTEVWQSSAALITSTCSGVLRAGLVTPWHPHTSLTHSPHPSTPSTTVTRHNVTVSLSLQVPPPKGSHPYLLVWVPRSCSFEITVSLNLFSLFEKLSQLYVPLLLPWVTAATFLAAAGGAKQSIGLELIAMAILFSATSVENGILNDVVDNDWQLLSRERLWCGWVPLVIHLIARGVQHAMATLVSLIGGIVAKCCRGRRGTADVIAWAVMVLVSIPFLYLCSGISLLCILLALTLKTFSSPSPSPRSQSVICLLLCLQSLTIPSILSWAKALRYTLVLPHDPHLHTTLPMMVVAMAIMYRHRGDNTSSLDSTDKERWSSTLQSWSGRLLGVLVLLFGLTHAYRAAYAVLVYLLITVLL